jgi:hypothetical protein
MMTDMHRLAQEAKEARLAHRQQVSKAVRVSAKV